MDVTAVYAARALPKVPLSSACAEAISRMRRTPLAYRPTAHAHGKRYQHHQHARRTTPSSSLPDNWRQKALVETHRRMKEREDPDYDVVVESVNKLSKEHFTRFVEQTLVVLKKRDHEFRLRVSTLLFDRGVQQNFFAPLIAQFIQVLAKDILGMTDDILTQVEMFDTLYDASKVVLVPSSTDPTYDDAIIAWTKQKEKKRGYAVLVGELYKAAVVPVGVIDDLLRGIAGELETAAEQVRTDVLEEHVDHLVRFLFAVAPNVKSQPGLVNRLVALLMNPRTRTPSLTMKSRFKLEDALKILKSASA